MAENEVPHDPHLANRILERDAESNWYLSTKGPFRNLMARPQLMTANAVDGWYTMLDNDKFALVRGAVKGLCWGIMYSALAIAGLFALTHGAPIFGLGAGSIALITMGASIARFAFKEYRKALIMDPEKGAKKADEIAQKAGALPPPGVHVPLAPLHSAAQDPNIYQNIDKSTRFQNKATEVPTTSRTV